VAVHVVARSHVVGHCAADAGVHGEELANAEAVEGILNVGKAKSGLQLVQVGEVAGIRKVKIVWKLHFNLSEALPGAQLDAGGRPKIAVGSACVDH